MCDESIIHHYDQHAPIVDDPLNPGWVIFESDRMYMQGGMDKTIRRLTHPFRNWNIPSSHDYQFPWPIALSTPYKHKDQSLLVPVHIVASSPSSSSSSSSSSSTGPIATRWSQLIHHTAFKEPWKSPPIDIRPKHSNRSDDNDHNRTLYCAPPSSNPRIQRCYHQRESKSNELKLTSLLLSCDIVSASTQAPSSLFVSFVGKEMNSPSPTHSRDYSLKPAAIVLGNKVESHTFYRDARFLDDPWFRRRATIHGIDFRKALEEMNLIKNSGSNGKTSWVIIPAMPETRTKNLCRWPTNNEIHLRVLCVLEWIILTFFGVFANDARLYNLQEELPRILRQFCYGLHESEPSSYIIPKNTVKIRKGSNGTIIEYDAPIRSSSSSSSSPSIIDNKEEEEEEDDDDDDDQENSDADGEGDGECDDNDDDNEEAQYIRPEEDKKQSIDSSTTTATKGNRVIAVVSSMVHKLANGSQGKKKKKNIDFVVRLDTLMNVVDIVQGNKIMNNYLKQYSTVQLECRSTASPEFLIAEAKRDDSRFRQLSTDMEFIVRFNLAAWSNSLYHRKPSVNTKPVPVSNVSAITTTTTTTTSNTVSGKANERKSYYLQPF